MKKRIFFFVTFLLFISAHSACAGDVDKATCAIDPNVAINVTPVFEEPLYNYSTSIAELQVLSRDAFHVIPESLTLGLTRYQPVLGVNPASTARDMPDGTTCVRVEHVDITFGYRNVVVYIAREIPRQSCGFDQVMQHEQKHVLVQKQILNNFIPVVKQRLKDYLAENGAMQNRDYMEAVTWLRDNVQLIAQDVSAELFQENLRLQRDIDTVDEYARVGNSCNGQLHQVLQSLEYRR
jgi:hypothetical protein